MLYVQFALLSKVFGMLRCFAYMSTKKQGSHFFAYVKILSGSVLLYSILHFVLELV